jgi:hypothetical protein
MRPACKVTQRIDCFSKIIFWRCDIAQPTGTASAIATALETLLTAGTVGVSPILRNIVWGDPNSAELILSDCQPAQEIYTARELTFEDAGGIDLTPGTVTSNPYLDRVWWNNIYQNSIWNYSITTCSGKMYNLTQSNGTTMANGTFSIYQTVEKVEQGVCYEVKKGKIKFIGDPISMKLPYIDLSLFTSSNPGLVGLFN